MKYRIMKVKWDSFKLVIKMHIEIKNNDRIRSEEENQLTCQMCQDISRQPVGKKDLHFGAITHDEKTKYKHI